MHVPRLLPDSIEGGTFGAAQKADGVILEAFQNQLSVHRAGNDAIR